jgi:hypothetical protein
MQARDVAANMRMAAAHLEELRAMINAARAARGSSALSWTQILGTGSPAPQSAGYISATHVMALRARIDEALQDLVPPFSYTDPDCSNRPLRRLHISQLQERVQ